MKVRTIAAALLAAACADPVSTDQAAPDWWRPTADVSSPVGGVWQSKGGACLYVWHDRIQWDGEVTTCDLFEYGDGYGCLNGNGLDGWFIEPIDKAAGYLGDVVLTFPEGREVELEPECM